jgi:hypothetical protein
VAGLVPPPAPDLCAGCPWWLDGHFCVCPPARPCPREASP